jgi:ATP-dependent Clp protease ATP-binding subunit ClpC
MDFSLDLKCRKTRLAKQAKLLKDPWVRYVGWLFVASLALLAGLFLTKYQSSLGYLMLIPFWIWLPIWLYYSLALKDIQPEAGNMNITNYLGTDVLMNLDGKDSAGLLKALENSFGGRFLASRFGISARMITNMLEIGGGSGDIGKALERAYDLAYADGRSEVSSVYLLVAYLEQVEPNSRAQILGGINLSDEDLPHAIDWFNHFEGLVKEAKLKKGTGGLGRDLNFGYTPLLDRYAHNISSSIGRSGNIYRSLEDNQDALDQMIHVLSSGARLNAGLVGRVGIGKSNMVWNLAEKLLYPEVNIPSSLKFKQIFVLDPSTILAAAGQSRGGIEELLIRIFNEATRARNVIIFLDDAGMFLEDGTGKVDLSGVLSQVLEAGGIQLVLALDDQDWLRLSQSNPGLASSINRINMVEPDAHQTMLVAQDQVLVLEGNFKVRYMYQTLKKALDLAERFMNDFANPGKTIKLLEYAASFAEDGWVGAGSVEKAVEKNFGIKVGGGASANKAEEADKLLGLEDLIHQRMINQSRAVKVVSDAMRRASSGVRNTKKPMGTFLFVGPTGVGKTELAKSLADVYFGGEANLVRTDMNEFSEASSVVRLLAGAAENPNSLTAQISKQPFSVVLLDELEKAHPNVINVLLQMLDEGILRDTNNKEVSFRESIVIATSNAGAEFISSFLADPANAELKLEDVLVKHLIDDNIFKPEFINRFDELVVFRSLNEEELAEVVELIIKGVNKNLALQKIQIQLDRDAVLTLVKEGNDPLMGARPMRRIVQKTVENIIAERILRGEAQPGTIITLTEADVRHAL